MASVIVITVLWPMMNMGREFMPELEEGNLWIRAIFPVNTSLESVRDPATAGLRRDHQRRALQDHRRHVICRRCATKGCGPEV